MPRSFSRTTTRFVLPAWPLSPRATKWLAVVGVVLLLGLLAIGLYLGTLRQGMPSLAQLENPTFELAAVAYAADGPELARFSSENRSWASYEQIAPHVIEALIATEDHRFYQHAGIDYGRTVSAVVQTVLGRLGLGDFATQGGSTITQQLARNLYNEEIGFERSVTRKLKEMWTARALEDRYTKEQILELYLNTVAFAHRAHGIETAAQTFFGTSAAGLTLPQGATLVGMLKATTRYNPVRNPENATARRNLVLRLMMDRGFLGPEAYETARASPLGAAYHSSALTVGLAPHFAQVLQQWLTDWGRRAGVDIHAEGLRVHTTLDSRLQALAQQAVDEQLEGLQQVVGYEWSRADRYVLGSQLSAYAQAPAHTPFAHLWTSRPDLVDAFIRETPRYRQARRADEDAETTLARLRQDEAFMDSLHAAKTHLQAGLVAIDPRDGAVRAWVGGRDVTTDWNDHVAGTRRQPGSTFKPFVYATAIDNGYSPSYALPDRPLAYTGPYAQGTWSPRNFGGASGGMISLRRALATSNNLITARVITELVTPPQVAFYARRMGIESPLRPVASLGLGTSDVTLLELTSAYSTLASGGRYHPPHFVSRIEDRTGRVLYEAPGGDRSGTEVLSRQTAYTVVDMLRGAVEYGTAVRLRSAPYRLGAYDLAAKTGTTQNSADGWFVALHPELVTSAWVGFNDRRLTFRSTYWGQGAHNALFVVGHFLSAAARHNPPLLSTTRFPGEGEYGLGPPPASQEPLPVRVLGGKERSQR